MFSSLEVRHLRSVIVLADELNFTRAADKLHITQSALSKQITELEQHLRFALFTRDNKKMVQLTEAGRTFVGEARSALHHAERAVHLARAAHEGCDGVLSVGHSPFADPAWISTLLAIELPLFPKFRVKLASELPMDLIRSVLAGQLDLAVVTAPPPNSKLIATPFTRAPLYAVFPDTHHAAIKDSVALDDFADDTWILFAKCVQPLAFNETMNVAEREGIQPKEVHEIMGSQQALHLVMEGIGIAILTEATARACHAEGVVVRPLANRSLCFETSIVMRKDNTSRLANAYIMAFLRKYQRGRPEQMKLPIVAPNTILRTDKTRRVS